MRMTVQTLPRVAAARPVSLPRLAAIVPLVAILSLQVLLGLSLRNTAFQDESLYLYAGRQVFDQMLGGPKVLEPYSQYFSGWIYLYPMVGGALDKVGGLELARMFSLACMLSVTLSVYAITKYLFDRDSALLAAAFFAIQGSVVFLGRLATYDSLCMALLSLAIVLALRSGTAQRVVFALPIGILLGLAVVTKFAGLLFVPVVLALIVWQTAQARGWWQAIFRVGLTVAAIASIVAIPILADKDILVGMSFTTTQRTSIFTSTYLAVAERIAALIGITIVLALLGMLLGGRPRLILKLICFGAIFLSPAYHIYKTELVSLHKHVVFSLIFAAPFAGYAVARLSGYGQRTIIGRRWMIGVAIFLVTFGLGFNTAQSLYAEWPNSTALIQLLTTQVRPSGRILAEESEVPRYYLQDIVNFWQWNGLYWFYYTDKQGNQLTGDAAYRAAINEGYFDLVILRYGPNASTAYAIDGGLKDGKQYELIGTLPFSTVFGPGNYWVWRRHTN